MAERLKVNLEQIQGKLLDELADGIGLYAGDWVTNMIRDFGYSYIDRNLGAYSEGTVKILLSLIDTIIPDINRIPYIGDWLGLWGRDGVRDVLKVVIDKPSYCKTSDENTIECVNFDELPTHIFIDGTELASNAYTVSGTAESFKISLANPLSSGKHTLLVTGKEKAFAGWIKV